eukprot:CAMPEP_0172515320 /NCGR_PEP_ID=MMETSP1066-20121228/267144_1 /TAXON_ID=671091 /ORGANISM="Coscinodiscus wailesii, Strain CCMP2513" /LENGTH=52 /DNA_ID=CAMNT_0013296351 /DNA_START=87 /DNA_END=245 /DNA_ORIENTATION=+
MFHVKKLLVGHGPRCVTIAPADGGKKNLGYVHVPRLHYECSEAHGLIAETTS